MEHGIDPSWVKIAWTAIGALLAGGIFLGRKIATDKALADRIGSVEQDVTKISYALSQLHTDTKLNTQAIEALNSNLERALDLLASRQG